MAEIILVRHGQASFGADNYDQLSDLGSRQGEWLGAHLNQLGCSVEHIIMGGMERHRQTSEAILRGLGQSLQPQVHNGLNEYRFQGLLQPLRERYPGLWQDTGHARRDYYHNMKQALGFWMDGVITDDGLDSWNSFIQRIDEAFECALGNSAKRTLVVTSGGPIAVILAKVLEHNTLTTRRLILQIKNTSRSQLLHNGQEITLDSFNDVSHLSTPERQQAITFS